MPSKNIYTYLSSLDTEINHFYLNRYIKFVNSSKNFCVPNVYHTHHILPVCLFPQFENLRKYISMDSENYTNTIMATVQSTRAPHDTGNSFLQ